MSDAPRRRSLESLKKDAKRWLADLESHDALALARWQRVMPSAPPATTLREVQHALATELGHRSWIALRAQVLSDGAAITETLEQYNEKVAALLDAYRTGTPAAMERHWAHTWHQRAWSAMRTYVQVDLGRVTGDDVEITTDDARWLVAREHGFEDWATLEHAVATSARPARLLAKPFGLVSRESTQRDDATARTRDWDDALSALADPDITGIVAPDQMTDALLRQIVGFTHLTSLRVSGSHAVTDAGIALLAQMPNLRHLDLSGTAISDAGVAKLGELRQLEHLALAWTRVTDTGVRALAHCDALQHVDLNGTHCGDDAIRTFAGKPQLAVFKTGRATTDDGLSHLHDYPVFKQWHGNSVPVTLMSYDDGPNNLMLRGNISDRGIARLSGLDGLFGLNIDDRALAITGTGLAPLVDLPRLGRLAFDARDDAMPIIARMANLQMLACQDTEATDAGWVSLGASRSIMKIWGRRCHGLEHAGFRALSRIPTLESLSVSCRNVDDTALAALPDFPALRELMPMDIPDHGYRHIARCTALDALVLMYCRDTTDAATEQLVALPALRKYFASYTQVTDRTPRLLAQITSLEHVTFDCCAAVTNAGIAALAALPRLRDLRVSGQRITSSVRAAFPARVTVHYSL